MRVIPLLAFVSLLSFPLSAQHSLFDKAVVLDSLYDRVLDGEESYAGAFFDELHSLYPSGRTLANSVVYEDMTQDNEFLLPKVNYVYDFLDAETQQTDAEAAELRATREEVIELARMAAAAACPEEDCDFGLGVSLMFADNEAQVLRKFREALPEEQVELAEVLRKAEVALYRLDVKIDRLKRQDGTLFSDGDDVGLGLPVSDGAPVDRGFAPIIVQAQAGSAQGALIDGASRWIAERMREELSIAFFDRFEVWMEEKKMGHLFPSTIQALDITATTDYALMLQVLRNAFENDLEALPFNIGPFLRQELAEEGNAEYIQWEADEAYADYRKATVKLWASTDTTDISGQLDSAFDGEEELKKKFQQLANTNKGLNYVLFSIAAMSELSRGNHPANLLSLLNERSDDLFPQGGTIRPVLMLGDVLVRSFVRLDDEEGTTWVSRDELTRLSRDQQLRDIYFGLVLHELHQKVRARESRLLAKRRRFAKGVPYKYDIDVVDLEEDQLTQLLADLENEDVIRPEQQLYLLEQDRTWINETFSDHLDRVGTMLNSLSLFTERLDNLQAEYRELRAAGQAGLGNPQTVELIRHSLTVVEPVLELALQNETQLERVRTLSDGILNAYTGVLEKDYDAVILNVIPVANTLLDVDYAESMAASKAAGESDWFRTFLTEEHGARKHKLQEVFRYSAFLAAVAESRNPEEIKQAIRAIALPTGSYSIKRRNFANISLNAYPGLTGGYELVQNDIGRKWAPNTGFTAPVGVAVSWGYRGKIDYKKYGYNTKYRRRVDRSLDMRDDRFLTGHSGSLFFPLLDLGAVVLFRLDDAESSLPEDVGFQQVFSPGVMYSHGFPNIPISVMAGVQVSPQLRKFGDAPADSFRFNLGITVDLPMANFHTRSVEKEE